MIKVSPPPKSTPSWVIWAAFGSFAIHGVLFAAGTEYSNHKQRPIYETSRIEFSAPPPEPEPEPELSKPPEPTPKPALPKPKARLPKPNTQTPPPPKAEPPKPIFGATADSVGNSGSGVAIRIGNTLEKEMEKGAPPKKNAPLTPAQPSAGTTNGALKKEIQPVPVYRLSKAPAFKKKIEPIYPTSARESEVEGVVQLEVLIDEKGRVQQAKVLKTPGGGLEQAAIRALKQSHFEPGIAGGKAVPVKMKIPYRFVLDS